MNNREQTLTRKTIRVIGDTHGIENCTKLIEDDLESNFMMNGSYIHVGDFGIGFKEFEDDVRDLYNLNTLLQKYNNKLYVVRGNHDNPRYFKGGISGFTEILDNCYTVRQNRESHKESIFDNELNLYSSANLSENQNLALNAMKFLYGGKNNIHFMPDYYITKIDGIQVLFIGGATSIDREQRMNSREYKDYLNNLTTASPYWPEEKVVYREDCLNGNMYLPTVDMVVTHTAPSFVGMITSYKFLNDVSFDVGKDCVKERMIMDDIAGRLSENCRMWVYGHYHKSMTDCVDDRIYKCIGQNEIQEVTLFVNKYEDEPWGWEKPF